MASGLKLNLLYMKWWFKMKEHILDKIVRADGKHLVYYREVGSFPTDVKMRVE